jgi:D-serine deaminase-like pyridoxal phosphate-dependent protein
VDLDILDKNIETVHSFFKNSQAKLRPRVEAHRCPAIAHKQLAAAGTVGGISVGNVGVAEVFAQQGFGDILVAGEIVTSQKITRLCALAHSARVTVAVDSSENVKDLSDASRAGGVSLIVVVDVNTGLNLCGVEPGQPALELAKVVAGSEGLTFAGLMSIERAIAGNDAAKQAEKSKQSIQKLLDTRELLESNGLSVDVVSIGGTHDYEIAGATAGVTEVPAGAYALMDAKYKPSRPHLTPAAKVMATVTSRPEPGTVILDSGKKAIGDDTGMPLVEALPDHTVAALSAEHGRLMVEDGDSPLKLGDKVWLTPWDLGASANVYDYMQGVRNGRLEAVLDVAARGRYR